MSNNVSPCVFFFFFFTLLPLQRSPHMSAVHRKHDAGGQDVSVAVHRVQVLQSVRNLRERCEHRHAKARRVGPVTENLFLLMMSSVCVCCHSGPVAVLR